jgi:hypothetical protein
MDLPTWGIRFTPNESLTTQDFMLTAMLEAIGIPSMLRVAIGIPFVFYFFILLLFPTT